VVSVGKKGIPQRHHKQSIRCSTDKEAEAPKSDDLNIWDPDLGWVLKNGKPTINTKAFWAKMRRKFKQ